MNSIICSAIGSLKRMEFLYEGGNRIVEPFCHGFSKDGNELLRAYQVGGHSSSGSAEGWKLFRVDKISGASILDEGFSGNRPGYNPNDSAMTSVHCSV